MTAMHVELVGPDEAEHVVLLHGGGFTGTMWRSLFPLLSDFRLVVPDLPGHGRSIAQWFASFEATADALAETIRHLDQPSPPHVVGLSLGGYVGLLLAMRHPELVSRAVLSGFHIGTMPQPFLMKLVGDVLSPIAATPWFQRRTVRSLRVPAETIAGDGGTEPRTNARTVRAVNRAAVDFDARADLHGVTTPVLAVAGGREHRTILQSLRILEREVASCTARVAPDLGHAWPLQAPELFAATVRAWAHARDLPPGLVPVP